MALDRHDYEYFDGKFVEVHDKFNKLREDVVSHVASPCPKIEKHIDESHKDFALKSWTFAGTIITVVTGVLILIAWYFHLGGLK